MQIKKSRVFELTQCHSSFSKRNKQYNIVRGYCKKSFGHRNDILLQERLHAHALKHIISQPSEQTCSFCKKTFKSEKLLKDHISRTKCRSKAKKSRESSNGSISSSSTNTNQAASDSNSEHLCNVCSRRFTRKRNLDLHKKFSCQYSASKSDGSDQGIIFLQTIE